MHRTCVHTTGRMWRTRWRMARYMWWTWRRHQILTTFWESFLCTMSSWVEEKRAEGWREGITHSNSKGTLLRTRAYCTGFRVWALQFCMLYKDLQLCSQARIQRVAETLASWFECASFIWHVDADLAKNYAWTILCALRMPVDRTLSHILDRSSRMTMTALCGSSSWSCTDSR